MRYVLLASLVFAVEDPVTVNPKELAALLVPNHGERDLALRTFHGKQLRVTARVVLFRGDFLLEPVERNPKAKYLALRVQFADPAEAERVRKAVNTNAARRQETVVTLVGEADFLRKHLRPADDYEVPLELRPRAKVRVSSLDEVWLRMQQAMNEETDPRILEDARKKGKLVTEERYDLYGFKAARLETAKKPAKKQG